MLPLHSSKYNKQIDVFTKQYKNHCVCQWDKLNASVAENLSFDQFGVRKYIWHTVMKVNRWLLGLRFNISFLSVNNPFLFPILNYTFWACTVLSFSTRKLWWVIRLSGFANLYMASLQHVWCVRTIARLIELYQEMEFRILFYLCLFAQTIIYR